MQQPSARLGWAFPSAFPRAVPPRNVPRRPASHGAPRPRGQFADYERFKDAYDKLLREEPDNLVGLTLVRMDLDRSRLVMLGLPVPERLRMRFDFENE